MFIGHFAAGFALKGAEKRVPLAWLLLAAMWMDIVWDVLLLAGRENARIVPGITAANALDLYDYPFSHSLLFALIWAGLFYLLPRVVPIARAVSRNRVGFILAAAVLSHWVLDFIVHRPDLALFPGVSPKVGLDLWDYPLASYLLETALFIAGAWIYLRTTRGTSRRVPWGITNLFVVLFGVFLVGLFSPPPPNLMVVAWSGLIGALVTLLVVIWLDRRRMAA